MLSYLEEKTKALLKGLFPHARIKEQYRISHRGQELVFDFYLPHLEVYIECQGEQHYKFTAHFHTDEEDFKKAQTRDALKKEWIEYHGKTLVELPFNDIPMSTTDLFNRIKKALTQ